MSALSKPGTRSEDLLCLRPRPRSMCTRSLGRSPTESQREIQCTLTAISRQRECHRNPWTTGEFLGPRRRNSLAIDRHRMFNYRVRRPPMFNMPATIWKNQMPIRVPVNNHVVLPQRPPVKEFHNVNKLSEYSAEYRPEAAVLPSTHRGSIDDDKGPIHTIPAPNLSIMDKPFSGEINSQNTIHRQQATDATYKINPHG